MLIYVSKRSATISWRGAYKKIFGFTNPSDGRKRHFPSVLSKNMFSPHFEILPASWSFLDFLAQK